MSDQHFSVRSIVLTLSLLSGGCYNLLNDDSDGPLEPNPEGSDVGPSDAGTKPRLDASAPRRDSGTTKTDAATGTIPAPPSEHALDGASVLHVLTYNVAGLPEGLSSSQPARNSALISPLLNDYDLTLLQEDFAYHEAIVGASTHPYRSPFDNRGNSLGDGLSFLSTYDFAGFQRYQWEDCSGVFDNGSDCLTPKGFSVARFTVGEQIIDVYDLHADAGSGSGDQAARAKNLRQLASAIKHLSTGHAVIVAGDFNARYTNEGDNVLEFANSAGLTDVWVETQRSGEVPQAGNAVPCSADDPNDPDCERIDKVFYRSAGGVLLQPRDYKVEGLKFVDLRGAQLSDHRPVSVIFDVSADL